jgi:hypothetical protein
MLQFFVQYLIPTVWLSIYSGLTWRPLISLYVHDSLIWNLLVSVIIFWYKKVMFFYPTYSTFLANSQLTTNIYWPCYCTVHVYVVIHWPCYRTVNVYVVIQFCVDMWSFWMEANLCRFFIICLYMHCLWRSRYQEGRVVIPLTGLALPCFCDCPKLIPVEYILPSLFKVFSCTKTTKNQEIF